MEPKVTVTLNANGELVAELPGLNGARRHLILRDVASDLCRILQAQLSNKSTIGLDGAPTQGQIKHWEKHGIFADPQCPWCRSEGRFTGRKDKVQPIILSNYDGVVVRRLPPRGKARKAKAAPTLAPTLAPQIGSIEISADDF